MQTPAVPIGKFIRRIHPATYGETGQQHVDNPSAQVECQDFDSVSFRDGRRGGRSSRVEVDAFRPSCQGSAVGRRT